MKSIGRGRPQPRSRWTENTSLSCSMRDRTRDSWLTEATWSVAAHDRGVIRPDRDVRGQDVDLRLRDDLGDVAEEARPVVRLDADRDRVGLRRRGLPLHVDEPADLALVEHRRAGAEVDRHALAAGDEALDRVAGDRVAALGEPDEEVPHPLDADAAGACRLDRRRDGRAARSSLSSTTPRRMTTDCGLTAP